MNEWIDRLGWTLIHFVWQGMVIAVLFAVFRRFVEDARWRYSAACLTLSMMAAAPVMTCVWLGGSGGAPVRSAANVAAAPLPFGSGMAASAPLQSALPWLVMAWLAGATVFSVRLAGGWLSAARMRSSGTRPAPAEWQATLERLITRMRIVRPVRLLVSPRVEAPAVMGWLRPVVLAPVGALTGLPAEHVEALLAHELAHIVRNDYLINLLQGIAEAVLFYHPAVWWVSKQIRAERELCCDDLAVAVSGDVLTYARALAELETCRPSRMRIAMAAGGASLAQRITRLVEPSRAARHTMPGPGAAWALSVLLLLGIGAIATRGAQEPVAPGQIPKVARDSLWMDTVKQGNVAIEVRGLGVVKSPSEVELKVAESQLKEVRVGAVSAIGMQKSSQAYAGIVDRIHPEVMNGVVAVDLRVPGTLPASATPGTQVDGTIQVGMLTNVVYVGRPVFGKSDQEMELFRLEPDGKQAVRVKVRFGRASVNQIEVRSGLKPGDKVIVSDMSKYANAERVELK